MTNYQLTINNQQLTMNQMIREHPWERVEDSAFKRQAAETRAQTVQQQFFGSSVTPGFHHQLGQG